MSTSIWLEALEKVLRKKGSPVIETVCDNNTEITLLSAANLWILALERKKILHRQGLRPGDIFCVPSDSNDFLVNLVASAMGTFIFWPVKKTELEKFSTAVVDHPQNIFIENNSAVTKVSAPLVDWSFLTKETVLLLSTSGTTGAPRLVGFSGQALLDQITNINRGLGCESESGRLIVLPFHHCFGLILDLLAGLFTGQHLHWRNNGVFTPEKILKTIRENEIQHLSVVPRMADLLLLYAKRYPETVPLLSKIQLHSGGAVISDDLANRINQVFANHIEGYGMTEFAGGVLLNGKPNNGCTIKLIEDVNLSQGLFQLGIRSSTMGHFSGQEKFMDADGFFQSGDIVKVEKNKAFKVLGRNGSLIKMGLGTWIHTSEIEQRMRTNFSLEYLFVEFKDGQLHVYVAANVTESLIKKYVEKYYGFTCLVFDIRLADQLENILLASQKKSESEAIIEWFKKANS